MAGDRYFAEDEAIVGGLGRFRGRSVMVIGHEKGSDTESRIRHNFGMAKPEGYRKAVRLMELAERFGLPVITLIDTAGAYPGIGAEERGQAEAIARSTDCCLRIGVPLITVVIGEGGSGGAIAIASGEPHPDARARDLHGRLARGRRLDPVARFRQGDRRRNQHEDHRPGSRPVRRHRRDHHRAGRRRASRPRADHEGDGRRDRPRAAEFDGKSPAEISQQRHDQFMEIGKSL